MDATLDAAVLQSVLEHAQTKVLVVVVAAAPASTKTRSGSIWLGLDLSARRQTLAASLPFVSLGTGTCAVVHRATAGCLEQVTGTGKIPARGLLMTGSVPGSV